MIVKNLDRNVISFFVGIYLIELIYDYLNLENKKMKNKWVLVGFLIVFFSSFFQNVHATGGNVWHETQLTSGIDNSYNPNIATDGTKLYYIYTVDDGTGKLQLWTAYSDMDGTNFTATQRTSYTTVGVLSASENIEVAGSKVIFAWIESKSGGVREVWTASMDTDGNNWAAIQQTSDGNNIKVHTSMDVHNSKVFLTWHQTGGGNSVYTAIMNLDGSGFAKTKQTANLATNENPQILATDTRIFVLWREWNLALTQSRLRLGYMNFDGTGWTILNLTGYDALRVVNDIATDGTYLYAVWYEGLNNYQRLMYSRINFDGTGFNPRILFDKPYTPPTPGDDYDFIPHIEYNSNHIYMTWEEYDSGSVTWDIFTGVLDLDDGEFRPTQRLSDSAALARARFAISGNYIYYAYTNLTGVATIYMAIENNIDTDDSTQMVTATVPSSLTFTVTGVTAGNACANSGGNASVTTTSSSIPFGIYNSSQTKIACQTLTVSTNATDGYVVTVQQNQDLTSNSDTIAKFSGTYALPTTWTSPPGSGTNSYFGFTTDDSDYGGFQTAKYAKFAANNTPYNVAIGTQPVVNAANVISYQLETNALQEAGTYTNTVMYIATATF